MQGDCDCVNDSWTHWLESLLSLGFIYSTSILRAEWSTPILLLVSWVYRILLIIYLKYTKTQELFLNFCVGLKVGELNDKGIHIQILTLFLILQNFLVCPARWQSFLSSFFSINKGEPNKEKSGPTDIIPLVVFSPFSCHHLSLQLQRSIVQLHPPNVAHCFHSQLHRY